MTDNFRDRIQRQYREAKEVDEKVSNGDLELRESDASSFLQNGFGPTVSIYVESRTGGGYEEFSGDEFRRLEWAMNKWLELYADCHGVDLDLDYSVREAAELLVDTHSALDAARVLTKTP